MAGTSGIRSVVESIRRSLNIDSRKAPDAKPGKTDTARSDSELPVASKDSPNRRFVPEAATMDKEEGVEYQDVVIAGAGPAGLLLATMLGRHSRGSRSAPSFVCVEPQMRSTPAGHADGLNARSIEMFKSLGLLDELLQHAVSITERAMWAEVPQQEAAPSSPDATNGFTTVSYRKMMRVAKLGMSGINDARSYGLLGLRQGTIEDVLSADLHKSAPKALIRGFQVTDVRLDETNPTHPVVVIISKVADDGAAIQPPHTRTIRCRHLVGADGAHSTVRKKVGIVMEGDNTDQIFGVVDLVVDTDFPDVRRCVMLQNSSGMIMGIPRERNAQGEWLTRFYVDVKELEMQRRQQAAERETGSASGSDLTAAEVTTVINGKIDSKAPTVIIKNTRQKSTITEDDILNRLGEIFSPFRMKKKAGTAIDWSTSYAIGQRVASEFVRADSTGMPRIFLVGDACHTHSPKLGQGMNVSMADSFNLAWKLTRTIPTAKSNNVAAAKDPVAVLQSYATERRAVARRLIEIDRQWYALEWSADAKSRQDPEYQKRSAEIGAEIMKFATGLGIVYSPSFLTQPSPAETTVAAATTSTTGVNTSSEGESTTAVSKSTTSDQSPNKLQTSPAQPGRRLANRMLARLANGERRDLQDEILADSARFYVLVFTGSDVLNAQSLSSEIIRRVLENTLPSFNASSTTCEARVITPEYVSNVEANGDLTSEKIAIHDLLDPWARLPTCVKRDAEMETFSMSEADYFYYGLTTDHSTILVVRPDGWVGARFEVAERGVEAVKGVEDGLKEYLGGIFRRA